MAKLYEISDRYKNLDELLDNPELEDAKETIRKALDDVDEEFDTKAENVAKVIKSKEVDYEGIDEEIKRLQARKKSLKGQVDNLKGYLFGYMKGLNKRKIKGKLFTLSVQKNSPSVDIEDVESLPQEYQIPQAPKIDKKLLLNSLKNGAKIPGAKIRQSESLRIR